MHKKTIDRRWLPLNALRAFEGVAKHGSFTAAANALLISQSALSRHVIALERLIGVQLFERRPHALTLTKAGQHLLPAVVKSFDRLEYALDDIRKEGAPMQRTLRVQMPPSFAVQLAVPILRDFRRISSEVDIDLISPYGVGPPLGDVDVAVVYSQPDSDRPGDRPAVAGAARNPLPSHHRRHARRPGISPGSSRPTRSCMCASTISRATTCGRSSCARRASRSTCERGLVFDTAVLAAQYALGGQGIALADPNLFADEIGSGRLVRPFEPTLDSGYGYYLTTPPEGLGDTAIALFRSWLIERFGARGAAGAPPLQLAVSNG